MEIGDMNQRNARMNIEHKSHIIKTESILYADKRPELSSGDIKCQSDQWELLSSK